MNDQFPPIEGNRSGEADLVVIVTIILIVTGICYYIWG